MKLPKEECPVTDEISQTESLEEAKQPGKQTVLATTTTVGEKSDTADLSDLIEVKDFSTLGRLVRFTAWVKRFVHNAKAASNREPKITTDGLRVSELRAAEREWVKIAQISLKAQRNFNQLKHGLRLRKDTVTDVLRCEGRLANADLAPDARKPLILPKVHPLTKLIIIECHVRVLHSGLRATLAELRSRYWVPRGRQIVKKILSSCVVCRRLLAKAYKDPPTADLPEFRVTESPPFSRTGLWEVRCTLKRKELVARCILHCLLAQSQEQFI